MRDKQLIQDCIDRTLYCPGYKEKLLELNKQFDPTNNQFKVNRDLASFKFPLEKAI